MMDRAEAIKVLQSKLHLDCSVDMAIKELEAREVAIAALREQEQRERGCEYCAKGFAVLNETMEYSGLEFALMLKSIRVRYFPDHEYTTFRTQDILPIKFCPMCGRKLTEPPKGE